MCFKREIEREIERERDTTQAKAMCYCQSRVTSSDGRFLFLSHQLTSWNPRSRLKTKASDPPSSFRFDQPRQAVIPCELTRHDRCVNDGLPQRERQLVNSISGVETELELFHRESIIDLPRRGRIR